MGPVADCQRSWTSTVPKTASACHSFRVKISESWDRSLLMEPVLPAVWYSAYRVIHFCLTSRQCFPTLHNQPTSLKGMAGEAGHRPHARPRRHNGERSARSNGPLPFCHQMRHQGRKKRHVTETPRDMVIAITRAPSSFSSSQLVLTPCSISLIQCHCDQLPGLFKVMDSFCPKLDGASLQNRDLLYSLLIQ